MPLDWDEDVSGESPYDEDAESVRDTDVTRPPYFFKGAAFAAFWCIAYGTAPAVPAERECDGNQR